MILIPGETLPDSFKEKFGVIYCDNPWRFKTYSKKGAAKSPKYNTMTTKDLCELSVNDIAAKDCVLLLWTTDPFLEQAFEVIKSWGFEYKTMGFVWVKRNKIADSWFWGLGYWTRANPEYCLLATQGKPKRKSKSIHTIVESRIREHSRKPEEMYEKIEALVDGPYLELFARQRRLGWDSIGDEVDMFK